MHVELNTRLFCTIGCFVLAANIGYADPSGIGSAELGILTNLFKTSFATLIGLVIGLVGLWQFIINGRGWGVVMIVLGTVITMFPEVFEMMYNGINPAISSSGGSRENISLP